VIVSTLAGDMPITQRSAAVDVVTPGSWDGAIMAALGITHWAGETAFGLGALQIACVSAAVKLVSESVASNTLRTYRGPALDRQPEYDSPQAILFQRPAPGVSAFDFWSDTAAAVETDRCAVIGKIRDRSGSIVQLLPLDPGWFTISGGPYDRVVTGWSGGKAVDMTNDVIVIRAWSPKPAADGQSTLSMNSRTFRWAGAYEEYRGRYFENDGAVDQVIEGGPGTKEQRDEMLQGWARSFGGPARKGKIGMLWGQASLKQMNNTLQSAQAAELSVSIAQDVARAFRIYPASLLYAEQQPHREPNLEFIRGQFYSYTLMPRLRRIEDALHADAELFPDPGLYPMFDTADFLRADLATLSVAAHAMTQTGSLMPDEERALVLGLPRLPNGQGQTVQVTPVGGAPNTTLPVGDGNVPGALFDADQLLADMALNGRSHDE
jgi:HK97 family phage portal protein